jgi:microcystin-dependent protein
MSESFLGEIRAFAGNFAPQGWALCNGQLMSIQQNSALFSLLGTSYGGNGTTSFGLPDLQERIPMHSGNGPGLTPRSWGESGGVATVTLLPTEMAAHTHPVAAVAGGGDATSPVGAVFAEALHGRVGEPIYATTPNTTMAATAVTSSGGGQAHNNLPPFLVVNYIIALQGIFPQRP